MDHQKIVDEFLRNGCCKIENFLSPEEVELMKSGLNDVLNNMTTDDLHIHSVYISPETKADEDSYINSGDKVTYFFEREAFDKNNQLTVSDKTKALNKIGYALHWLNPYFQKVSFCQKVKDLLRSLEYKDPVVVQSMLIFKHPKIGEIVRPHQDSTFLYTDPPTCIGLWFPIEDATIENGCLWYVPGSHKEKIYQRYVRKPGQIPLMNMEGTFPEVEDEKYVPVPAKKGDCVLIHGSVIHKSGRNHTNNPRIIYTFHAVEKDAKWSEENWLQPTEILDFPSVYSN